jgi:hypothetical protein
MVGNQLWKIVNRNIGEEGRMMTQVESLGDRFGEWQVNWTVSVSYLAVGSCDRNDEPSGYTTEVWC